MVLGCAIVGDLIPRSGWSWWPYNPFDRASFKPRTKSDPIGLGLTYLEEVHDRSVMGHNSRSIGEHFMKHLGMLHEAMEEAKRHRTSSKKVHSAGDGERSWCNFQGYLFTHATTCLLYL
jgi:hypothetical protein